MPEFGVTLLRAKIDTGARTSALHAIDAQPFERDGEAWIAFRLPARTAARKRRCEARIIARRWIRNTSGVAEHRYVIETLLVMGERRWRMEISLADRDNMGFALILGRTAVRNRRLRVNPGASYLLGHPKARKTP